MSEAAPERRTTPPAPSRGGDGFFQKKYGPLPGWGWAALAGAAAVGYLLYRRYEANKAAASSASQQTYTASGIDYGPQLATIQEEIQNLQGGDHDHDHDKDHDKGPVKVPNVVGKDDTDADSAIKAAGLKVSDKNEPKGGFGKNKGEYKVSAQVPPGGTMVKKGSTVTLTFTKKKGKKKGDH